MKQNYQASVKTPFAHMALVLNADELVAIDFLQQDKSEIAPTSSAAKKIVRQINAYCKHNAGDFDVKLDLHGTDFQKKVWRELLKVPFGTVKTYGELAKKLKTSARAVGNACRRNPVPLIVPCHRIVSASGIGGYAGTTSGAVHSIKRELLDHEGHHFA
ncbi:MAG: methylated-DNA--[protein]-cysteine S-methyltransferase [Gammaproteobacteria bacterium]